MPKLVPAIVLVFALTTGAPAQNAGESTITPPDGGAFYGLTPQFSLSPDGGLVVFVGNRAGGPAMLFLRTTAASELRAVPGTEQASYPFWSADGKLIAYFASGKLWRVPAGGGAPSIVCDAPNGRGGTWSAENVIVFSSGITDPLRKVSASGGQVSAATTLEAGRENSHRWPHFLPDGVHVMFWAGGGSAPAGLKIAALDSGQTISIGPADTNGAYAAGHLFFGSRNALMAQPFDAVTLRTTGDPVRIAEPLSGDAGSNFASLSASVSGTLAFTRGTARPLVLTWFDRKGTVLGRVGDPGQYTNAALSPDDKKTAVSLTAGSPANRDVWTIDGTTGAATRLTTDPAVDATPLWSPDGTRIAFSSTRGGPYQIYVRDPTAAADELLLKSNVANIATDWSHDGQRILFTRGTAATGLTLWILERSSRSAHAYLETKGAKDNASFSPDGRFVAFQSNESGRDEVYVLPVEAPASAGAIHISAQGGTQPLWRGDGKELFFLAPDGAVMSRAVTTTGAPQVTGEVQKLFAAPVSLVIRRSYAVSRDGQRVLMPILDDRVKQTISVIPRWSPQSHAKDAENAKAGISYGER